MKRKLYLLVVCAPLSASASVIVQAMQTQEQEQAQTITTCVRSLKVTALLELAKAIQAGKVRKDVAIGVLPKELRVPLESLLTANLTISELEQTASKASTLLNRLSADVQARTHRMICYLLGTPVTTIDDLLITALRQGDTDTVKILLEAGADPNKPFFRGGGIKIPLIEAMYSQNRNIRATLVELLLNAGADPNKELGPKKLELHNPLMHAVRTDNILAASFLLDAGADVNVSDPHYRKTPLIIAAEYTTPSMVAFLLNRGADKSRTDIFGKTALDYAQSPDIRRLLTA